MAARTERLTLAVVEPLIEKVVKEEEGKRNAAKGLPADKFVHTSFDEVLPGIFVGDEDFARDKEAQRELGITHILNAAQGNKFTQVNTDKSFYADTNVTYMGIKAVDIADFKLAPFFRPAAKFIHEALQSGGRMVVHCQMGYSRSSSLVLAYLMLYRGLALMEAVSLYAPKRKLFPNEGFIQELIELHEELAEPKTV